MISPAIHRKWAREFLDRAQSADRRARKLHYLRLAVNSSICAHNLEQQGAKPAADQSTGAKA